MGGSLIIDNMVPVPYSLDRGLAEIYEILNFVRTTNSGWSDTVAVEEYLAGSARVAIDNRVAMRNLGIELGDIDIFVDRDWYDDFCDNIEWDADDWHAGELLFFRKGKLRSTALVKVFNEIRQVDFIPCEFENGKPKQFFAFSHSSNICDMKRGVKGFAHKLLCRAYTADTDYHFSVDYGLRQGSSYEYDTDFMSVVNKIFLCNAYKVWSFTSLLQQLAKQPHPRKDKIIAKFAELVFGPGRQKSSRYPEKDLANMTAVFDVLCEYDMAPQYLKSMYETEKGKILNAR